MSGLGLRSLRWVRWLGGNNWSASRIYILNLDRIDLLRFLNLLSTLLIPVQKTIRDWSEKLMLTHTRAVVIKWGVEGVYTYMLILSVVTKDNQHLVIVCCRGNKVLKSD